MNDAQVKTNLIQNILRILLGAFMLYAGIGHLTFLRTEFQAQVPTPQTKALWISLYLHPVL